MSRLGKVLAKCDSDTLVVLLYDFFVVEAGELVK